MEKAPECPQALHSNIATIVMAMSDEEAKDGLTLGQQPSSRKTNRIWRKIFMD